MFYSFFYLVLASATPWIANPALSVILAQAPQVQTIEAVSEKTVPVKIAETRESLKKWIHSDADVLSQFDLFSKSLQEALDQGFINEKNVDQILDASLFAAEKHQNQTKNNEKKTPYIIHPIEVADIVMRVGHVYKQDVLVAALLHDVIEDTGASFEDIAKRYGIVASSYVKEMTEKKELSLKERKKAQIIGAFHQTPDVAVIKFSDKLSNLNTLLKNPPSTWSRDKVDQYFLWAQSVIENLPESNQLLKKAVKQVITDYWEKQSKSS